MSLLPGLRDLITKNVDNTIVVFNEISANEERINKFIDKWGYDGDDVVGFVHGFLVGSITETVHLTARLTLNRPLSDEERAEIAELINERTVEIAEIVTRLRNA